MERQKLISNENELNEFNLQIISATSFDLRLYGVNKQGASVSLKINDFKPLFYIRIKTSQYPDVIDVIDELETSLNELSTNDDTIVHSIEIDKRIRFIGAAIITKKSKMEDPTKAWERKKYNLLKITFTSIDSYFKAKKYFNQENKLYTKWKIHDDYDIPNQFLQRGFLYHTWYEFNLPITLNTYQQTKCNFEANININNLKKSESLITILPKLLKVFINILCLSRDGTLQLKNFRYYPNALLPCDNILACCLIYSWSDNIIPIKKIIYSSIPLNNNEIKDVEFLFCSSEYDILQNISESLNLYDPDYIFHFPDIYNSLVYIAQRANIYQLKLPWERKKNGVLNCREIDKNNAHVSLVSRTLFDLRAPIRKKASVLLEAYDIRTISCHKDLRKNPMKLNDFQYSRLNYPFLIRSYKTRYILLNELLLDTNLIFSLEQDCNLLMEYSNISTISNCSVYTTVSGGEQIRVFNRLIHTLQDEGYYLNKKHLVKGPIKFNIKERPPTFEDPSESKCTTILRQKCHEELEINLIKMGEKKLKKKVKKNIDLFQKFNKDNEECDYEMDYDESSEEEISDNETNEKEGGNVMFPCPKYWHGKPPIAITDFVSLYPSVMIAYNISYENIVMDQKYVDIPSIPYIYVAINADETVAIIDYEGLMGKMLKEFIRSRKIVKKKMEFEIDPFKKSNYNKQQESLKVICNATYGFCGADGKGALLPLKVVMYIVTSLGRFLQKCVGKYLGSPKGIIICSDIQNNEKKIVVTPGYEIPSIYGDTDSLFLYFGSFTILLHDLPNWCESIGKKYNMRLFFQELPSDQYINDISPFHENNEFSWLNVISHYKFLKKNSIDFSIETNSDYCVNAVMFLIYDKLSKESTKLFRIPICLEFENALKFLNLFWMKKFYYAQKYSPNKPNKPETSLKITGTSSKKRDWCYFTRCILNQIMSYFATGEIHLAKSYVIDAMKQLASGNISIDQLQVSCQFKGWLKYKDKNSKQCQIVLKMEERNRCQVEEKTRISFVVIEGSNILAERVETPEFAKTHNLKIDWMYYLKKQFYKPVKKLFILLPDLIDFHTEFQKIFLSLECQKKGIPDMNQLINGTAKRNLNINDLKSTPMKKVKKNQKKPIFQSNPFQQFISK